MEYLYFLTLHLDWILSKTYSIDSAIVVLFLAIAFSFLVISDRADLEKWLD